MLPDVALNYASGTLQLMPQDDALATFTREWRTADAKIDWEQPAHQLDRLIRAANPWPVAWTTLDGDRMRILEAQPIDEVADLLGPGAVTLSGKRVLVGAGDGALQLVTIQPPGKRPMLATDWWRGQRSKIVTFWT
jgi:methionyl-tRNA formyltransferase